MQVKAVVTDIEGTTSSLSFVKDVLFPYSRQRMGEFIRQHGADPKVRELVNAVCETVGSALTDEQVITQLEHWIDEDKKITPLKALQGMIWEAGYRNGDFKGHIYEDAVHNLRKWRERGLDLYVFSSGSVYAQKLLFGHTEFGDLTSLFSGYFDTNVGSKSDVSAYKKITETIGFQAQEILFLSDIEQELDAAQQAGMQVVQLVRDSAIEKRAKYQTVASFDDINTN
jgi:enolase-phosphatase E1